MGVDFGEELAARGHTVRLFEYRRDNALYKNKSTKAAYQLWILRLLERACASCARSPTRRCGSGVRAGTAVRIGWCAASSPAGPSTAATSSACTRDPYCR